MNQRQDDIYYFAYLLGYAVLHDKLIEVGKQRGCDVAYDISISLATRFVDSEEFKTDFKHSGYELLWKWVDTNKDIIEQYIYGGKNNE